MTACAPANNNNAAGNEKAPAAAEEQSDDKYKYYEEMPSVPTADSCIDEAILETDFFDDDGNKVYGYYVSDNSTIANQKFDQYIELLKERGYQFIKKPNMALARKNGESLFGVALMETDKGLFLMDVLFFTGDSGTSSDDGTSDGSSSDYGDPGASGGSGSKQYSTMGERQALNKALQSLDYSAFSYSGLVEQLEYEGFSHSEATYGADNCGADWNEQAAKKAKQYLDYSSFSRQGLVEQLEYEGFTHSQAEYGVSAVGY